MPHRRFLDHVCGLATLALPLVGSQMAQFAISVTDTVMLGRYDVSALAAQVLASAVFITILLAGSGFGWAVTPIAANALGAGRRGEARKAMRMALWLSCGCAALAMPLLLHVDCILRALGQSPELAAHAADYLAVQGWSIIPALGLMVMRGLLSGVGHTGAVFWAVGISALANVGLNYVLIFGHFGAPELGLAGAAWASLVSTMLGAVWIAWHAARLMPACSEEDGIFARLWKPDREALTNVFRLGWPISLTTLMEVGLFSSSSIVVGTLGEVPLAAHGIALQITSMTFMLHIGVSQAATIQVGAAHGRGDGMALRWGSLASLTLSGTVAAVTTIVFLTAPETLMGAFLGPGEAERGAVVALGATLLALAALFQAGDAGQVLALGLLRGVQDTRGPMWITLLGYWGLGAPLGYFLAIPFGWGAPGVWVGLTLGLWVTGAALLWRFWRRGAYAVENGSVG